MCRASLAELESVARQHPSSSAGPPKDIVVDLFLEHIFACPYMGFQAQTSRTNGGGFLRQLFLDWLLDHWILREGHHACIKPPADTVVPPLDPQLRRRLLASSRQLWISMTREGCSPHATGLAAIVLALFSDDALSTANSDTLFHKRTHTHQ